MAFGRTRSQRLMPAMKFLSRLELANEHRVAPCASRCVAVPERIIIFVLLVTGAVRGRHRHRASGDIGVLHVVLQGMSHVRGTGYSHTAGAESAPTQQSAQVWTTVEKSHRRQFGAVFMFSRRCDYPTT